MGVVWVLGVFKISWEWKRSVRTYPVPEQLLLSAAEHIEFGKMCPCEIGGKTTATSFDQRQGIQRKEVGRLRSSPLGVASLRLNISGGKMI